MGGWEVFKCVEDAKSFDAAVRLLGGEYKGSLGPLTNDVDDPAYKSAYVLIGAVGIVQSEAPFEKYCFSNRMILGVTVSMEHRYRMRRPLFLLARRGPCLYDEVGAVTRPVLVCRSATPPTKELAQLLLLIRR